MALSLSCLAIHARHRLLNRKASSGPPYRPESIARVHAAVAWSPEGLPHVSKSSAAAGIAANQTIDAKARTASMHRRIDLIGMVPRYPASDWRRLATRLHLIHGSWSPTRGRRFELNGDERRAAETLSIAASPSFRLHKSNMCRRTGLRSGLWRI